MATSKRKRKARYSRFFSKFSGKGVSGINWDIIKIVHGNTLKKLLMLEMSKTRIYKKCDKKLIYNDVRPLYGRWMVPLALNNPVLRSRIKNQTFGFRRLNANEIPAGDGQTFTEIELTNLYYAGIQEI